MKRINASFPHLTAATATILGVDGGVVAIEKAIDRGLKIDERAEDAALEATLGEGREEAHDELGKEARFG